MKFSMDVELQTMLEFGNQEHHKHTVQVTKEKQQAVIY